MTWAEGNLQSLRELIESGKGDEALQQIEKTNSGDTHNPEALYLMAVATLLKADEEKAQSLLQQAQEPDRNDPAREAEAYYWAGSILLKEGDRAHIGLHYINRAISLSPEKGKSAAYLLKERGIGLAPVKPWIAHRILDKAFTLLPALMDDDDFFYSYSIQTITDPRQKIQSAEKFINQFPGSPLLPQMLIQKAEAHYMLGEFSQSKAIYQKIAGEYSETPQGKRASEKLASWKEFSRTPVMVPPDLTPVRTGIIVEKGQQLMIGASGVSLEGPFSQGPDGRKQAKGEFVGLPFPSAPPMALIAKIGEDGHWFLVGRGVVRSAERKGEIYLMMNRPEKPTEGFTYKGSYSTLLRIE